MIAAESPVAAEVGAAVAAEVGAAEVVAAVAAEVVDAAQVVGAAAVVGAAEVGAAEVGAAEVGAAEPAHCDASVRLVERCPPSVACAFVKNKEVGLQSLRPMLRPNSNRSVASQKLHRK